MYLSFDGRNVEKNSCASCGREYDYITGFLKNAGDAFAIYYAQCHGHGDKEAWLDVTLGTWGEDDYADHVTFSCRLRTEGAAAVDATVASSGVAAFFGQKLTREEALAHSWLPQFWEVVDFIALGDETLHHHLYDDGPGHSH